MLTNAIRGFAAEFGIVARQGPWHVSALRQHLKDIDEETVPAAAGGAISLSFDQFDDLGKRINELEERILRAEGGKYAKQRQPRTRCEQMAGGTRLQK